MKKILLILAMVGMVAVGCTEGGVDDNIDNGGNNTEQPGEDDDNIDNGGNNTEQPGEDDDDENKIPDDAYISINKDILTFSPDGESVEVKVYSNYEWTLTNNCDWVTTSISGGKASEEGTAITLTADLTYDDREGTITFSCGKAKKLLVVSQSFKEAIIADENNTFNLPVEGGTVDIAYQTTVECEVIIPEEAKSWISLAPETRGLESGCATLNIAANNTGAELSTVVKVVKMGDQSVFAEYTITQERNMDYIIFYTTTNGETISPYRFDYLTNTYEDGVGMLAFDGSKVTSIREYAFSGCTSLTSVTIPDSVTSIGRNAFLGCTSLTSVTIGNGVTSIGSSAFNGCTGELIVNCNIPSATDSNNRAFYGADFTKVTIGDSVTSIGRNAFYNCTSLTSVTIGNGVTSIGSSAFYKCTSLTSVTIGNGVTEIGEQAFYNCSSLTSITIPDSVTSIRNEAFYECTSLTSVTIGNGVTEIGGKAFYDCTSLTSVTIPDSITSIGDDAFRDCYSLTSVYITDIAAWCNISFGNIDSNPLFYAKNLYLNNELVTDLIIPNSVTEIGSAAFYNCDSLTSVTIPDSVTEIGSAAFRSCTSLTSVTIGNGITSIGSSAFYNCTSLTSVTIPDSITSIGDHTFYNCDSLTSVTIPDSVTSIGRGAFIYCDSLTEVYCKPTTPPAIHFYSHAALGIEPQGSFPFNSIWEMTIYVPRSSYEAYTQYSSYSNAEIAQNNWYKYESYIEPYDFE